MFSLKWKEIPFGQKVIDLTETESQNENEFEVDELVSIQISFFSNSQTL